MRVAEREPERIDRSAVLGEHGAPDAGGEQRLAATGLGAVQQLGMEPHRGLARDVLRHLGPLGIRFYGDHPSRPSVLDVGAELFAQGREEPRAGQRQVEGHVAVHRLRPDQGGVRPRSAGAESGPLQEGDAKTLSFAIVHAGEERL